MRTGGKTALTVRGTCLAAGLTFLLAYVQAEDYLHVTIGNVAVSIKAANASIRSVLEELSRQSNLAVVSRDALDELVTVDIEEPTLAEAIRRLLRQKSFMLHQPSYATGTEFPGNSAYSRLWILSGESNDSQPTWTTQAKSRPSPVNDSELIDYQILALSDNSGDREDAMVGFGDVGSSSVVEYLQYGLSDPDEGVREAAIESLAELGGAESVQALSVVLYDPDAAIRVDAVDALGEIGGQEAIRFLQVAMTDDNHTVREAAAEWLTELAWQHD